MGNGAVWSLVRNTCNTFIYLKPTKQYVEASRVTRTHQIAPTTIPFIPNQTPSSSNKRFVGALLNDTNQTPLRLWVGSLSSSSGWRLAAKTLCLEHTIAIGVEISSAKDSAFVSPALALRPPPQIILSAPASA
ncbi:hypothetical protein ACHAXH_004498 [Discostella pseudostelligera]